MEFKCRLGTVHGEILEGVYVAENESRLRRELEDKGLHVLSIRRKGAAAVPGLPEVRRRRVSSREFVIFNQELATLLKAGLPLVQSLDILRQKVPNRTFKAVLDDVYEKVRSGTALSEAFEAQGDLFPPIYTASLLAGEKSGSLDQVLRRYISYVKVMSSVRRRTLSALIYPAILMALSIAVVLIILLRVVPQFSQFYETFDAELPWITRMLTSFSSAVRAQLLIIVLGLVAAGVGAWLWFRQPDNRARLDGVLLKLPVVGTIVTKFATTQFSRTLATLLGGGIPLVSALDVSGKAVANRYFGQRVNEMVRQVREGQPLAAAMTSQVIFPDVAVKMVEVGEATGALQDMLNAVADFFDEDIDTTLGRFVAIIEPLLLVIMGLVIAALLLALYLPVFQLSSAVG